MNLFSFLLRNSKRVVVLAVLAGAIGGISSTSLVALIHTALSKNANSSSALLIAFGALCAVVLVMRIASQVLLVRLGQGAIKDLRLNLSRRILNAPLRRLEDMGAHKLLASLTDDTQVISNAIVGVPMLCINVAIVAGCLIYLGWLSWSALLAVLGFMVVGVITYQLPLNGAMRSLKLARQDQDALFGDMRALTEGTKELKIHRQRRRRFLSEVLEGTAEQLRRHNVKGLSIYIAASSWGQLLFFVLIGLLVFALPQVKQIDNGTLAGYTLVLLYMMAPLEIVLSIVPMLGRASIALKKVEEMGISLRDDEAAEKEPLDDVGARPYWRRLELAGVTHSYHREKEDSSFVLGPIDLSFEPGEVVFLAGGNGSGKTTLAKLLVGLYSPESGSIYLDSQLITEEQRESYREHFSVVFSDFYVFEKLIGLEGPELDERAREYLVQLQLDHKVKVEGGAFSTTALSQGQRKRLALLTCYLEDRPFYVFDEWASDQDPLFKEIFYTQLLPELKARGKAVLVISHDDYYYFLADRVVKLDYGRLIQEDGEQEPASYGLAGVGDNRLL